MTALVLICALLALPVILLAVLRVNAMMVFLSLCLGVVLVRFVGEDASTILGMFSVEGRSNLPMVTLVLLFLPAVFTVLFLVRSVRGHFKLFLNLLIAVAVGALVALLVEPQLPPPLRAQVDATVVWSYLQKLQTLVVALGAIFSLLYLWLQRSKRHAEDAGGKAGKHHKGK